MCDKCKIYKSFPNYLYCPICAAPLITNSNKPPKKQKSNYGTIYNDNDPVELKYSNRTNYNQRNENK